MALKYRPHWEAFGDPIDSGVASADCRARGRSSDLLLLVLQKCDFLTLLYELCSNDRFEVPISARKCDFERFKSYRFPSPHGGGETVAFETFKCSLL